jgi:hypothetical protein
MRNFNWFPKHEPRAHPRGGAELRILFPDANEFEAVQRVLDLAPDWGPDVVLELAKAGVSVWNLGHAVVAVDRIVCSSPPVEPLKAARFVATVYAITGLSGQQLLFAERLFAAARDADHG